MRNILFIFLSLVLVSCSLDSDSQPPTQTNAKWSLIQAIGGVAGTSTSYQLNQINWTFNEVDGTLIVEHNTAGVSDALDPGTYDYSIQSIANDDFLFIDDVEYGSIRVSGNRFTINQNIASDGSIIADKFEYRFAR